MRLLLLILLSTGAFASSRKERQSEETNSGPRRQTLRPRFGIKPSQPVPSVPLDKVPATSNNVKDDGGSSGFVSLTGSSSGPNTNFSADPFVRDIECGGEGSACVPYYLCQDGLTVSDEAGLIDIRIGSTIMQRNSKCLRFLEVCCKKPEKGPITAPPIEITKECGQRNIEGVHANIIGAGFNVTQTQFAEYPWMVALLRVENIGNKDINLYICGGSLIYPNVVLTAAHCVKAYDVERFKVRAGEWDTQSEYELYPHQDRLVSNVIIHPNFQPHSLINNLAILVLEKPFILAPNINTICLPNPLDKYQDATCFATGWGKDKYGVEGQYQNILKQVPLKIVPSSVCENLLRNTRLGKYFALHESFVCAGGEKNVDTCKGDGGSPLVCARQSPGSKYQTYYQVGIVAWGIGCGENGVPGVYVDVSKGLEWFTATVQPFLKV